jgi:hypothetical protein
MAPSRFKLKCALNEPDSAAQRFVALKKFQHPADTAVPVFAAHSGHVRMEIWYATAQANHGKRIAHQLVAIKSAQHLSAGMRRDHKHGGRLDLQVGFSPDLALELHATMEFIEAFALPHDDFLAHCFVCAPLNGGECGFPSDFFAASQNLSIT